MPSLAIVAQAGPLVCWMDKQLQLCHHLQSGGLGGRDFGHLHDHTKLCHVFLYVKLLIDLVGFALLRMRDCTLHRASEPVLTAASRL